MSTSKYDCLRLYLFVSDLERAHPRIMFLLKHPAPFLFAKHNLLVLPGRSVLCLVSATIPRYCLLFTIDTHVCRRPIAEHVLSVEQVTIVLPYLLARRAVYALGHVIVELRLGHEDDCEREESYACAQDEEKEHAEQDVPEADEIWGAWGEVVLQLSVTGHPAHREGVVDMEAIVW